MLLKIGEEINCRLFSLFFISDYWATRALVRVSCHRAISFLFFFLSSSVLLAEVDGLTAARKETWRMKKGNRPLLAFSYPLGVR